MADKRRHFGRVRKLLSGKFQARYPGPDGVLRPAPFTFDSRAAAARWLSDKESEIRRGEWLDPEAGKVKLHEYGARWIKERPGLRPRTVALYEGLLANHIVPTLGELEVGQLKTEARIRTWRRALLDAGVGPVTVAKSYRLLRAILNTAVVDKLISQNPCQIRGAGEEKSPERPVATLEQVFIIAAKVAPWHRAMVLLACFGGLRWGELLGLARRHIDLESGVVTVNRALTELDDGTQVLGEPKSESSKRRVTIPAAVLPEIKVHLDRYVGDDPEALVFVGPKGGLLHRANFAPRWKAAIEEAGVPDLHFHDLRHTGNTWASESGATLRELMDRLGHASTRAALIYLHKRDGRDRKIADALSSMVEEAKKAKTTEGDNLDSQTETEPTPERPKQTKRTPESPAFGPLFLAPDAELSNPDDDGDLGGLEPTGS